MTKEITLFDGHITLVDDEDYDRLSQGKWYNTKGYATGHMPNNGGKSVRMHRLILNAPSELDVDHINGDGLDNRRSNLRLCTTSQNNANQRRTKSTTLPQKTSKFKGVNLESRNTNRPWKARISHGHRIIYIGTYATEEEAAKAYDCKAVEIYGEFAHLNFSLAS